jgi:hypothetical protein
MGRLIIPNLAKMGVIRKVGPPEADLITVWATPYPVIRKYLDLCRKAGIPAYGGGSMEAQREDRPGFITSGYRDEIMEGNKSSPHLFAIALDIAIGSDIDCLRVGDIATRLYPRVGLYPGRGFIHVDLAPDNWMAHYRKKPYWVKVGDTYRSFDDFISAEQFMRQNMEGSGQ